MRWGHRLAVLFAVVACAGSALGTAPAAVAQESSCTRDVLRFAVGGYFNALAAHDSASLPWSSELKSTENGASTMPGQGLWQTASATRFRRSALDTETCSAHTQAILNDGTAEAIVGIRFTVGAGPSLTEVETYVTHSGDYFLFNPNGLVASDGERTDVRWEEGVPEDQRSTREELVQLADDYFSLFGSSVDRTPFQTNCDRWENGQRMTSGTCTAGIPTGTGDGQSNFITHRRYPFVDVENGIVIGYAIFAGGLDFHMFKVVDGQVRLITAVVTDSGHTSTGWEEQEQP